MLTVALSIILQCSESQQYVGCGRTGGVGSASECNRIYEQIKGLQLDPANLFPAQLECCFTLLGVADPVLASDGRIYSRSVIEQWWASLPPLQGKSSPYTREPMTDELLTLDDLKHALVRRPRAQQPRRVPLNHPRVPYQEHDWKP